MLFADRRDAGRQLAERLRQYTGRSDTTVLALPRGGVPVGYEIAGALRAPLDVFLVRKLGVPGHEELALGAVALGGVRVLNADVVRELGISRETIERVAGREQHELERRARVFRGDRAPPVLENRVAILVDDGLATGATMRAAVAAVRQEHPARTVVAVPVAARPTCQALRREADAVICLATPDPFYGVGLWYADFAQTSDDEVRILLEEAAQPHSLPAGPWS